MPNLERPSESLANYCSRLFYNIKKSLAGNIMSTFMTLQDPHTLQSYQVFVHRHVARCKKVTDLSFQSHLKMYDGHKDFEYFSHDPFRKLLLYSL